MGLFKEKKNMQGWSISLCCPTSTHRNKLFICTYKDEDDKLLLNNLSIFKNIPDFPGGPEVESICQCKGAGFDPWSGEIPHAMGQLSPVPQ